MNAERLRSIAIALTGEMAGLDVVGKLTSLANDLRQIVNEPDNPNPRTRVTEVRDELHALLRDAPSNRYSPAWHQALVEMGIDDLVGERLREQIEAAFVGNDITPTNAAEKLEPLAERLNQLLTVLTQVRDGTEWLKIGEDDVAPGDFEIGFIIPRPAVDEGLDTLGHEFVRLTKIIGPFQEIAGDPRSNLTVRSLSSSAFAAFLHSPAATALLLSNVVERLLTSYEKVLNIKKLEKELKESDLEPATLEMVDADARNLMTREISQEVERLLTEAQGISDERLNELRTELNVALTDLAKRIDEGYNVDIRAGDVDPAALSDEAATPEHKREIEAAIKVREKQPRLYSTNPVGKPVLELPEADIPDGDGDGGSAGAEGNE